MYDDNNKIAGEGDSFSYNSRTEPENESNLKIDVSYRGFYGTGTIWNLDAKEAGDITFTYDSTVNNGDFKAVLINPEKEIENIFEGSQQGDKTIKLTVGKYRLKIVCRDANGEIKISIDNPKNVAISKDSF
ncbi:hypothetical protein J9303_13675 [Bacillaceae bacterium Marseille-Q3522]|nr:hypothetical protein [Bacillaceae bacterium Marseille-Q3522]